MKIKLTTHMAHMSKLRNLILTYIPTIIKLSVQKNYK